MTSQSREQMQTRAGCSTQKSRAFSLGALHHMLPEMHSDRSLSSVL
uniref:Uncharacterized protein n=1 Tax=Anopheles arabiensis TaxID=7173 RepID=A0A182IG99_ANOAR